MSQTLGNLITRVQMLLQMQDALPEEWEPAQIGRELLHSANALARHGVVQDLVWVQGVQSKSRYTLNEQALVQVAGIDTSGSVLESPGNPTTITDSAQTFTALDVQVGDRVRNVTDRSSGVITSIAATTVVCGASFTGGITNTVHARDLYIIERPLTQDMVIGVLAVLYNGVELLPMTPFRLDRLTPGWERMKSGPKYWSVDQAERPSVVQLHPAPLATGSAVPNFPMNPLAMRWEGNLIVICSLHPQQTQDAAELVHLLDWYHDPLVYDAASRLSGFPGQWQALSLSVAFGSVAQAFRQQGA